MTDLHTHILPGMDDGAHSTEESLAILRLERAQGVAAVVLTPHFYGTRERAEEFLCRRDASVQKLTAELAKLPKEERDELPKLILGAEVAWNSALADCQELPQLCIGKTKNFLLELPFTPWNTQMFNQIYDLIGQTGLTPVIAHLERYIWGQRPRQIAEIFELGVPVQISAEMLQRPLIRGRVLKLFEERRAHILASDCHNCTDRAPNVGEGMRMVRRKLGDWFADELVRCADELAGLLH